MLKLGGVRTSGILALYIVSILITSGPLLGSNTPDYTLVKLPMHESEIQVDISEAGARQGL